MTRIAVPRQAGAGALGGTDEAGGAGGGSDLFPVDGVHV